MNSADVPTELVEKAESVETTYMYDNAGTGKGDSEERLRAVLAAVLPEVARGVRDLGRAMREADGWAEEWSTREVRDALNIAADRIDRKGWS